MIVTTTYDPTAETIAKAKNLAERLNCRWVPRKKLSQAKLQTVYKDPQLLILSEREIKIVSGGSPPFFFHPSTALVRIKRLLRGESDVLIDISDAKQGDIILDCTAGLASDSIVFSHAAGQTGKVIAVESETYIALLIKEGLKQYVSDVPSLNEAMRRIEVIQADHFSFLQAQPDRSADIVYFDPMFRSPIEDSSSISPLRGMANPAALSMETVREACRVSRRVIVMKDHKDSQEFSNLGFVKKMRSHSNIAYGVMKL